MCAPWCSTATIPNSGPAALAPYPAEARTPLRSLPTAADGTVRAVSRGTCSAPNLMQRIAKWPLIAYEGNWGEARAACVWARRLILEPLQR